MPIDTDECIKDLLKCKNINFLNLIFVYFYFKDGIHYDPIKENSEKLIFDKIFKWINK